MAGTLFVVATPIGNLEDLSFRALRTLKEVDAIAAEDTRRTAKLLAHYAIRKSMVSLREHNERRETPRLIARLQAGESVALVSDAGTPGISDPGQHLVRSAREAGIRVSPIPGPSAVMAALSTSGEPASEFVFLGFPPRSGSGRTEWLKRLEDDPRTIVFFEAPHRIARTLADLSKLLVNRRIIIHRELTKINEDYVVYTNTSLARDIRPRGEFVVVVGKAIENRPDVADANLMADVAVKMFYCMTNNGVFSDTEAERLVSSAMKLEARIVRKAVKKARIDRKRADQSLS
jgi:16S rRNA (cytidine1402-2'-O)-methyltransferase